MDTDTTAAVETTARRIVLGTWVCAAIVMVTSAGNAVLTFGELGGNRAIGLGLGVAVDVALCVGLIGDRRLAAHGLTSAWGRVLRITAAAMSVVLNVGAALMAGHYFLAALHAFLPILLVVLTEYGQDLLLKFTALRRAQEPTPVPVPEPAPVELPAPPAPLPVPPPARPLVAPTPRRPAVKATRPTGVTPELVAQVRAWQAQRHEDGLPTGRRSMVADPDLGLTDGLARKVLDALKETPHLVPAVGGAK